LNAKLLNAAGVTCDVLAYAHYHSMGCPEWEDSDFSNAGVDETQPDWSRIDLGGFRRPRWFAQGPIGDAAAYLLARRRGAASAGWRWRWLEFRRSLITSGRWAWLRKARGRVRPPAGAAVGPPASSTTATQSTPAHGATGSHTPLPARFRQAFGDRRDQLTAEDVDRQVAHRGWNLGALSALFAAYDVVHAYGAEPILPLLTGFRPYVAYEHGTIRSLPFGDTAEARLVALAYRDADAVLITNADNRVAADRLGIERYAFVPHPVSEYRPDSGAVDNLRDELQRRLDADFIVFHPSRQHWHPDRDPHLEKGNDRLIRGLQRFFAERPRAGAVFVSWGQTMAASRALLEELGIAGRVLWIDPVSGPGLARYMAAADVVADQFFLGSFGAITPRALFLGRPPLLHLDEAAHQWCFPEPPPVLNASTPAGIAEVLGRACDDRDWLRELGRRGEEWYMRHHSNALIRTRLLDTYAAVLRPRAGNAEPSPAVRGASAGC
jgi:glycosyltransferase involved in cell wall biosynthesis